MRKISIQLFRIMLSFVMIAGTIPTNAYAAVAQTGQSEQIDTIDDQVADMESKIGKVEGSDIRFVPSDELISYARNKIDVENPTRILDYSAKTANHLPDVDEAKEYFIKAASEGQAGIVLYGDKDFAKNTIESVAYSASYGIYLRHLRDWRIDSQLIDPTNDIYRHLVSFQYRVPKSHTVELEERIDVIANWILSEYRNVNIPEEMKTRNNLDDKGVEDLQKAMMIHDYVIKNVRPYYGNLTYFGKDKSERHSLNSAMFEGETVCQGFYLLFSRLADRVGLETRAVRGYKGFIDVDKKNDESKRNYIYHMEMAVKLAKKGGRWGMDEGSFGANHGWNQVKIGNNWYHADMTGDSSYTNQKLGNSWIQPQHLYYKYFLKTDREFKEPLSIKLMSEDEKVFDAKQFLVWQGNENYDTPDEPFLWTYDILYDFKLNGGINTTPYLQSKFTKNYPMGNAWNDKGKFQFEDKDISYVPGTRYEMTIPGYENGSSAIKIKKGLQTTEEVLRFANVCGIMFKDGIRTSEGYVDFGTLRFIDVKHDNLEEASRFDMVKNSVGETFTLTAYFEVEGRRYEENIEFEIVPDGEFKSSTEMKLKDGADDTITVLQHVDIKNDSSENKRKRDEKIAEIDREILSRIEVVENGESVPMEEYSGEKRLFWKNLEFSNDNVPIGEPTNGENHLIKVIAIQGADGKWTSLEFKINLTEAEKTTTTVVMCDTDYIEKEESDRTGLIVPRTGREISDGGDIERFFRYRGYPIKMEWTNSSGLTLQRLNVEVYVLDEEGNPQYRTQRYYNGILMEKDSKGEYKIKTQKTLNQMFSTKGLYKFRIVAWNDEDRIKVSKDFTVKVYNEDEIPAPEKVIVKFDANGHGDAPNDAEIDSGETMEKPADLVADGWIFDGWYADKEGRTAFDFKKEIRENITIYAKWTKAEEETEIPVVSIHTVMFESNGHGIAPGAQSVEDGKTAKVPFAPVEDEWGFDGWYTEAECINRFDFSTPITSDITLFAKWTPIKSEAGLVSGHHSGDDGAKSATPSNSTIGIENSNSSSDVDAGDVAGSNDSLDRGQITGSNDSRDSEVAGSKDNRSSEAAENKDNRSSEVAESTDSRSRGEVAKSNDSRRTGNIAGSGGYRAGNIARSGGGLSRTLAKTVSVSEKRSGTWVQGAKGWWYEYGNGAYPKNEWKLISQNEADAWYAFDEFGYMRTDWFFTDGRWYYLNPTGGEMMTGWQEINKKWYYLEPSGNASHPKGAMYVNEKTPDGYTVDASGAWVK